ncbi:MAG: hypothetical protein M9927_23365 [Anaerolineae bacterium]|nr:hypothetical protein [Anaerolineae bacterium]
MAPGDKDDVKAAVQSLIGERMDEILQQGFMKEERGAAVDESSIEGDELDETFDPRDVRSAFDSVLKNSVR